METEFCFGTFEGFNFRTQSAIEKNLTAEEIFSWNHDTQGEAEFWPSGDCAGVALVFKGQTAVSGDELEALAKVLSELGGDSKENFLLVHWGLSPRIQP